MPRLPEQFTERMRRELGADYPDFIACYEKPPVRGLRVNTLKISAESFARLCPWELERTPLLEEGFIVRGAENVGRHPFHAAGLFYMQEPSAMSAIAASQADGSGLRVLDMCAAPGGKTGGVAARMKGRGILIANEIVPKRARLLAQNVERLGITNAAVVCERPDRIAEALPEYFDIVMVDAPCSGEGMFRKDETAAAEWSPEHVSACAERQGLILASAARCVKPGGSIVYSTCTFSHEENEGVTKRFLSEHADFEAEFCERLYPHTYPGEGHFVCRLRRKGGPGGEKPHAKIAAFRGKEGLALFNEFLESSVEGGLPAGVLYEERGRLHLVPEDMPAEALELRPAACGVELGELKKGRFEPSHTLFMAAPGARFRRELILEPESRELAAFLSGQTLPCPEDMRGWTAVCVKAGGERFAIGFGKAVDGVLKNHLPKGLYLNGERQA